MEYNSDSMDSVKEYLRQIYSELVLISIMFLFFIQLISDFVESVYAIELLTLSLDENALSLLFMFMPLILLLWKKEFSKNSLIIFGLLTVISRIIEPLFVLHLKMFISGFGVGCFFVFLLGYFSFRSNSEDEKIGIQLGSGLALALSFSILFRTIGSTLDISSQNWTQMIGWVLAFIAILMFISLVLINNENGFEKTSENISDSEKKTNASQTIIGSFGLISVLILIYFIYSSPTVISRWTEGNYLIITFIIIIGTVLFTTGVLYRGNLITKISPWILWLWNGVFLISLVLTIFINQVPFSSNSVNYPLTAPQTTIIHEIPLFLMLILFPIILIDFILLSRTLIEVKSSIRNLTIGFSIGSLFFVLMLFANIFTTTYDYIPVVGPFFRDKYWFVYLMCSLGIFLPILTIRKDTLFFKIPRIELQARFFSILLVLITMGTILGLLITEPIPTTPNTISSLKVLTYNIQQGTSKDGIKNYEGQLKVLREADADIIGLQESDTARISGGNSDPVRYFANNLNLYSYYGPKTVTGTFGIALLSKFPIKKSQTFFMYSEGEQTATIEAQIVVDSTILNIFVTHLGNDGPIEQQKAILSRIKGLNNVLLMGDFNFQPNTTQYNITTETLNDSWEISASNEIQGAKYDINSRIDHIFVSKELYVLEGLYLDNGESDHPVYWVIITY